MTVLDKSNFLGDWKIVDMELWDDIEFNMLNPAMLRITKAADTGDGQLSFCDVDADLDCRFKTVHRNPYVEFSLFGKNKQQSMAGRGYAILKSVTMMEGTIIIHKGAESWFVAQKLAQ